MAAGSRSSTPVDPTLHPGEAGSGPHRWGDRRGPGVTVRTRWTRGRKETWTGEGYPGDPAAQTRLGVGSPRSGSPWVVRSCTEGGGGPVVGGRGLVQGGSRETLLGETGSPSTPDGLTVVAEDDVTLQGHSPGVTDRTSWPLRTAMSRVSPPGSNSGGRGGEEGDGRTRSSKPRDSESKEWTPRPTTTEGAFRALPSLSFQHLERTVPRPSVPTR